MVSPRFELTERYEPLSVLRIQGICGVPLEQIQTLFSAVSTAYNSILLFDAITWEIAADIRDLDHVFPDDVSYRLYRLRRGPFLLSETGIYSRINRVRFSDPDEMVPAESQLLLKSANFNSPGFWDFLGKLNPLEVMRLYLNDRHERMKDKKYREGHENEKLWLENELLKNEVFGGRLRVLKEMGVTDEEMSILKNRLLHGPLGAVGAAQDRKLIQTAEIIDQGIQSR